MEQRRVSRIPVDWDLKLRQGKKVGRGRVLQFSEYGMLAGPPEVAEVGQHYELSFAVPGHKPSFRLRGFGAYTTPQGIGFRFQSLTPEVVAIFRDYVKSGAALRPKQSTRSSP